LGNVLVGSSTEHRRR